VGVGGQVLHGRVLRGGRGLVLVLVLMLGRRGVVLFLFSGKGSQVEGLAGGVGEVHGEHGDVCICVYVGSRSRSRYWTWWWCWC
jgi:hypothetical protein